MRFIPSSLFAIGIVTAGTTVCAPLAAETATLSLMSQFDGDKNGQLDPTEVKAARAYLAAHPAEVIKPTPRRPGEPEPEVIALEPIARGASLTPASIARTSASTPFDPKTMTTIFLEFDNDDWENALADFARTDIDLRARAIVDGAATPSVAVRFLTPRADELSPIGYKRSLELKFDASSREGERRMQLLDLRQDPSFVRSALFYNIASAFGPVPRANFVRLVINEENRGVYLNLQPFDEAFIGQHFPTIRGARFTVKTGTLAFLGDAPEPYRAAYHLETTEDAHAWARLIELCRTLEQVPPDRLADALAPLLDVESAVKMLAVENALMNQSGYRQTGGGYGLYLDPEDRFHYVPLAAESVFQLAESHETIARPRGERRDETSPRAPATNDDAGSEREKKLLAQAVKSREFPQKAGTDLAMLLSYSFVNKADHNDDQKVSKDEWAEFAHSWFFMMDEEHVGVATRDQFLASFRNLVTPPSARDQRSTQTFAGEDPAGILGGDFYTAVTSDSGGRMTEAEFVDAFSRWFSQWRQGKHTWLVREDIQQGLSRVFSRTVFQADQSRVKRLDTTGPGTSRNPREDERGAPVNAGLALGPLHLGGGRGHGGRRRGGSERASTVTYEQWLPLDGLADKDRPLFTKLLAVPALRAKYIRTIRYVVEDWLNWERLGPSAREYHALIANDVKADTHKAWSYEQFVQDLDQDVAAGDDENRPTSVKAFIVVRKQTLGRQDGIR